MKNDRTRAKYGSDELVRKFDTRHQFIALLYARLSGAESLRAIATSMASHRARLYHIGGKAPPRSTLADANRARSPLVFTELFQHMLGMADRKMRREMREVVRLIDSTSLHLSGAHVIDDPNLGRPVTHSVTAAKEMPIEAGASYVFDLGYYDYECWAKLDEASCRIVTRLKTKPPLIDAKKLPLPKDSRAFSDRIGFLPKRQAKNHENPMRDAVREIVVKTDRAKKPRILTNDLDSPADEIANLCKRRWLIELFFRLMKQRGGSPKQ